MRKALRVAGVSLLPILGLACVAAEPAPPPPASAPAPAPAPDQVISVLGLAAKAKAPKGSEPEEVGRIVDVLVDEKGHPTAAVIDVGGFLGVGNRKVAVEWGALRFVLGKNPAAVLDVPPDRIKGAPAYDPAKPLEVLGQTGAEAKP
ncbi:MAG: PRC-barrel domain-containing protein [Alphaproteobacteria bacterium]|nr:PRC-barrel domain-containing protein [Alphaproteobacteria bacterium]